MASCPNCQKQIEINEEHFGTLFRCSYCQSEFFVDFGGIPENSKEPLQNEAEIESSPELDPTLAPELAPELAPASENPNPTAFPENNFLTPMPEFPGQELQPQTQNEAESVGVSYYNQTEQAPELRQEFSPNVEVFSENPIGNLFNEVVDFGNDVQNHNGILTFDITIDEIDLPEQKDGLIEFLEDTRLGLDIAEIKTKLKYGKIEIQNFPAPKAIVLIQRIQGLSLKVYWRQNVSTQ